MPIQQKFCLAALLLIVLTASCQNSDLSVTPEASSVLPLSISSATSPPDNTNTPLPTSTAIPVNTETPFFTRTPLPFGFEPVTANSDWTPYIQEIDGVMMALVPTGCFYMGSTDKQIDDAIIMCEDLRGPGYCNIKMYEHEQPINLQCFDEPFWIDVFEVTNQLYGSSGEWAGDELPRERVTWVEADGFCQSRGARLPSEAEWEYAARGPDGLVFPWGNEFDRALVNSCDKSCEFNMIGTWEDDGFPNTAPVGSFPGNASWIGALDMSGNVWEWTSTIYLDYPYDALDGREVDITIDSVSRRILRGASWFHTGLDLLRSSARYPVLPEYSDYMVGFRCVASYSFMEPSPP